MPRKTPSILKSPASQAVYARLIDVIGGLGPFQVEEKKTSVHLTRGSAFAGISPRATGLILNLVLEEPLAHSRVRKSEQLSAHRHHVEIALASPDEVDAQLTRWIGKAYRLKA